MRLAEVRGAVEAAALRSGRDPSEVTLVVVTKDRSIEEVLAVYRAGQRDFGESRAAELVRRADALPSDVRWHFVGPLQRNKVRLVRPLVVLLHSLDRLELAEAWMSGSDSPPPVLLEVNVGAEPGKLGVDPERVEETMAGLYRLGVRVHGLMTVPPRVGDPEDARPYFRRLAELRDDLAARWPDVRQLSMGMTEDFEVAVEAGSTIVRVGRAIFGETEET